MILQRGETGREEVELTRPEGESDELPESISEQTSAPLEENEKHEEEAPAGTSPIDELLNLNPNVDAEKEPGDD